MLKRFVIGMLTFLFFSTISPLFGEIQPYAPIKGNLILPDGCHLLAAKAIDGTIIELEDGSQFKVVDSDADIVLDWESHAPLTISANSYPKCFRAAAYYVINQRDGTYVRADYFQSPVTNHPFTNTIDHIDTHYGEIYLIDGRGNRSCWQVNPKDIYLIQNWGFSIDPYSRQKIYDTAIVGSNTTGCLSRCFPDDKHILISYENSDFVTYVRATRKPL